MRKGENIYLRKDGRWEGRYPKRKKKLMEGLNMDMFYGKPIQK